MILTIVGLGYVGLPLAQAAAKSKVRVYGLDVHQQTVDNLNSGISHIDDLSNADINELLNNGFEATTNPECIRNSDYVVICVPTPLDANGRPDLFAIKSSGETIAKNLSKNTTVILESTTYPGTTEEELIPILEKSGLQACRDFNVAFSPERVDPGNPKFGISNTPKIVGGKCADCTDSAIALYSQFIDEVLPAKGIKEAETAKLLENTYRHINIALVNELAQLCHELEIDVWDVIASAGTKPFGFQTFWPSAGVGGHCIPIDPNYLAYKVRNDLGKPFKFIELAESINSEMPSYVVKRIAEIRDLKNSRIALLGISYKANIADSRETPAKPLIELLKAAGAEVLINDPILEPDSLNKFNCDVISDISEIGNKADLVVMLQPHTQYLENKEKLFSISSKLFDSTGKFRDISNYVL